MGLTTYVLIAILIVLGLILYFTTHLSKSKERKNLTKSQRRIVISVLIAEIVWLVVYLSGIWYALNLPETGFYLICFIIIAASIVYPTYLFFKKTTFWIATLVLIVAILFFVLLDFGMLITSM